MIACFQTEQGEGSLEVNWVCSLEAAAGPGQLQVCVQSLPHRKPGEALLPQMSRHPRDPRPRLLEWKGAQNIVTRLSSTQWTLKWEWRTLKAATPLTQVPGAASNIENDQNKSCL